MCKGGYKPQPFSIVIYCYIYWKIRKRRVVVCCIPKNGEPSLSEELFRSPTEEYRGAPFWAFNCRLEKETLEKQIRILRDMGFGAFTCMCARGCTPYLSPEFLEDIRFCVEKAEENHMLAWLYDEDRWPSGAAGGFVTKDPAFRARYLRLTASPLAGLEERTPSSTEDAGSAPASGGL